MGVQGQRPRYVVVDEMQVWERERLWERERRKDGVTTFSKEGIARQRPAEQRRANFTRKQLDAIDWSAVPRSFGECRMSVGLWRVWTTEHVAYGACYISTEAHVLVVSPDTWAVISFDPALQSTFIANFTRGAAGMKFLTMNAGPYGDAARALAQRDGVPLQTADDLDRVMSAANSLLVEASGLSGEVDPLHLQIFMERLVELRVDLAKLEARVGKVRSLVDLAGEAVLGAV